MRLPLFVTLFLVTAACAQDDAAPTTHTDRAEPTSAPASEPTTSAEPAVPTQVPATSLPTATTPSDPVRPAALPPPALTVTNVSAAIVAASTAENELGRQVAPSADGAVAIDVQFESLPGRALDPVLEIAGVKFRKYETRPGGVLRFTLSSPDLAEAGQVVLRWGDDVLTIAQQLSVSR